MVLRGGGMDEGDLIGMQGLTIEAESPDPAYLAAVYRVADDKVCRWRTYGRTELVGSASFRGEFEEGVFSRRYLQSRPLRE